MDPDPESREHPADPGSILRIQNTQRPNRCFKDLDFVERGKTEEGRGGAGTEAAQARSQELED